MTVLGVASGSGGVGCSGLGGAIGVGAAAQDLRVVVVDGNPMRGGLQVSMAAEHVPGHRWEHLVEVDGAIDGTRLIERLPSVEGVAVLSAGRAGIALERVCPEPLPEGVLDEVLDALVRAVDLVVVDWNGLPRPGLGPCVLIVPADPRGLADAEVWLGRCGGEDLAGLLTRGRRTERRIAVAIAQGLGLPLLGEIRDDRQVLAAQRRGVAPATGPPGSGRRVAGGLGSAGLAAGGALGASDPVERGHGSFGHRGAP